MSVEPSSSLAQVIPTIGKCAVCGNRIYELVWLGKEKFEHLYVKSCQCEQKKLVQLVDSLYNMLSDRLLNQDADEAMNELKLFMSDPTGH